MTARDEWLNFDDGRRFDERSADRLVAIMPTCTQINVCHLLYSPNCVSFETMSTFRDASHSFNWKMDMCMSRAWVQ